MSIKKTWFSYILWPIATGFTILFTHSYVKAIIECYGFFESENPLYPIVFSTAFVGVLTAVYFLIAWIRKRTKEKPEARSRHKIFNILVLSIMAVLFVTTRCMVLFSVKLEEAVPMQIFESAKIVQGGLQYPLYDNFSIFEDIYVKSISGLFFFLGNKMEIISFYQIFLQIASFWLLLLIGKTLQKGVLGCVPALVYVLSPYCMGSVICMYEDNFWLLVFLVVIALICLWEKVWINKTITYVLIVLAGIVFSVLMAIEAYPHIGNLNDAFLFWFYERLINGTGESFWGFLILVALLLFYCISFWRTKADNAAAYIIPIAAFCVIIYFDLTFSSTAIFMLIRVYMSFMAAEGLRVLFAGKQETGLENSLEAQTVTPSESPSMSTANAEEQSDIEKTEGVTDAEKTVEEVATDEAKTTASETISSSDEEHMNIEDTEEEQGIIRVSDILKSENTNEKSDDDAETSDVPVDKTAMIENVLPMPKKHVARTFEYAFEPTEDMMHYDVEIENDDYDYE